MPQVGRINASNRTSRGVVSDAAGLAENNKMTLSKVKANMERCFMNRLLCIGVPQFSKQMAGAQEYQVYAHDTSQKNL